MFLWSPKYDNTVINDSILSSDLFNKFINLGKISFCKFSWLNSFAMSEFIRRAFASLLRESTKYSSKSF